MTNGDPEVRHLLDQAVRGLSPSPSAKARVRSQLTAALANAKEPAFEESESEDLAPTAETAATSISRLSAVNGAGLLLLGLVVGGITGYSFATSKKTEAPSPPAAVPVGSDLNVAIIATQIEPGAPSPQSIGTYAQPRAGLVTQSPKLPATEHNRAPEVNDAGRQSRPGGDATQPKQLPHTDADEVVWVQRVQKALAHGEARLALGLLRELDGQIPVGRLTEERFAGRAIARCMLQPETGRRELHLFTQRYPTSVHLARITSTCDGAAKGNISTKIRNP